MSAGESYLVFSVFSVPGRRTQVVRVESRRHGDLLGTIRWFGRWRQYTFWPEPDTTFNPGCLAEINDRIRELMAERT